MPLLRLNEHYVSIQGEGPATGVLTQFVRFSGCNMRCPGWPCDTLHAVLPELYKNDPKFDSDSMISAILQMGETTGAKHVCVTGGEPFMQDNNALRLIVRELTVLGYTFDFFTNGSFIFPDWVNFNKVSIMMDWKLPGSGESATRLPDRRINAGRLNLKDGIKFVVTSEEDLEAARRTWTDLINEGVVTQFWVGVAWNNPITVNDVLKFVQEHKLPWRLNIQLHKYLWPNMERGI